MIKSGIYEIKNKLNGKIYIGSAKYIKSRFCGHKKSLKDNKHPNKHLQRAWDKYGEENFEFNVIELVENLENLISREQFYIDLYDASNKGYNICSRAGNTLGTKRTEEVKKKFSEMRKGKFLGNKNPMYGKERMDLSERNKLGKGKVLSEEHINKLRYNKRKDTTSVMQFSKDGDFIKEYITLSEASRQTNIPTGGICNVCKGKRKTAGGFIWKYK